MLNRAGFIGLGHMGHGMAHNLLAKGFDLYVLPHSKREACEDLVSQGAHEVSSARKLAEMCDVVVLCVTGSAQVNDLVRRKDGLASAGRAGLTLLDCTTSSPDTLLALTSEYPEINFVDAPLGRSPKEAWAGKLVAMVGCDQATLNRILPVLKCFATDIIHAGPTGAGHALKLVNNMISLGYAGLYSEALVMARNSSISVETFDELISTSRMNCDFYQTFMGWARTGNSDAHKFNIEVGAHTLADAKNLARLQKSSFGMLEAVSKIFDEAVENGLGNANLPELPRSLAINEGTELTPHLVLEKLGQR